MGSSRSPDPIVARAAKELETFERTDARSARLRVIEAVLAASDADMGTFYNFVEDAGRLRVGTYEVVGGPEAHAGLRYFADHPELLTSSPYPDARRSSAQETSSFMEDTALANAEALEASPLYRLAYEPAGMRWQQRLRIVHGRRFVGHVGVFRRREAAAFTRADRGRMQPLVRAVIDAIIFADTCERMVLPDQAACLVARPDGSVEYASPQGKSWLDRPGFSDRLRHVVEAFDLGDDEERHTGLEAADAHLVRLDGEGQVRYLVTLRPAPLATIPPDAGLTPRQREVAALAVSGSTVPEIARHLGRSPETVRALLAEVYRRLGVASRLELSRALERRDE